MANVKVSALASLSALAENDTLIVNDYSEATEKVKAANVADLRLAMLLPGVDNTNDIGSAIKRIKDVYVAGDVTIGDDLTVTGDITVNSILQGKDVTAALHRKIVEIGDWNMDATATVNVAHGLTLSKIRTIFVGIRDDAASYLMPLNEASSTSGAVQGVFYADVTNIVLTRLASGDFDATTYNSTAYNRGWITIDYVD